MQHLAQLAAHVAELEARAAALERRGAELDAELRRVRSAIRLRALLRISDWWAARRREAGLEEPQFPVRVRDLHRELYGGSLPADAPRPSLVYEEAGVCLFLGDYHDATNVERLRACNVGHVLSLADGRGRVRAMKLAMADEDDGLERIEVTLFGGIRDSEAQPIAQLFHEAVDIIVREIGKGRRSVLVHCAAGVSRSATICAAFLMKHLGMSVEEACLHLRVRRACVCPNRGFLRQLVEFEQHLGLSSATKVCDDSYPPSLPLSRRENDSRAKST